MSSIGERVRALWHLVSAPFTASVVDERTGDTLTAGEKWSWRAQLVMRRWPFLLLINVAVAVVWTVVDPIWLHSPADTVNYLLSLLAIDIEGLTAMALIQQCLRDAVINRAVRTMADQNLRMETAHGAQLTALEAKLDAQGRQLAALYDVLHADYAARMQQGAQQAGTAAVLNVTSVTRGTPRPLHDLDEDGGGAPPAQTTKTPAATRKPRTGTGTGAKTS